MSERAQLTYPFFSDLCLVPVCISIGSLFPLYIKQLLHWSFGFWKKEDITACSYFMNDGLGLSYPNLDPSFIKYEYKIINTWWMCSHCHRHSKHRRNVRGSVALYWVSVAWRGGQSWDSGTTWQALEICTQMLQEDGCLPAERLELSLHCLNNCLSIYNSTFQFSPLKKSQPFSDEWSLTSLCRIVLYWHNKSVCRLYNSGYVNGSLQNINTIKVKLSFTW